MAGTAETAEDSTNMYFCNDCNETFQEASEFHNHSCKIKRKHRSTRHYKPGPFECDKCGKVFPYKNNLGMHRQIHNEGLDFVCTVCKKKFNCKIRLRRHVQSHTARYACPVCNKNFYESGNLKKHLRIHTGEKPFVCDVCNKGFSQRRHLQDHQSTHIQQEKTECDTCGKKFLNKSILIVHKYVHEDQRPFGCKDCNASFADNDTLNVHSCISAEKPYYCHVCGKHFKKLYELKFHLMVHTNEQPYKCELCDKSYLRKKTLKVHMLSHTSEKNHACHLCKKRFETFSGLKKHCVLHTGERNFVCEVCRKSFKMLINLQYHIKTHTGELPFPCNICGKQFARRSTLENHFILHTGERPYVCRICKRGFTRKSSLKIHITAVHSKEMECKFLDNKDTFMTAGDLARQAIFSKQALNVVQHKEIDQSKESTGRQLTSENSSSQERCTALSNIKIESVSMEEKNEELSIVIDSITSINSNDANTKSESMMILSSIEMVGNLAEDLVKERDEFINTDYNQENFSDVLS